MDPKDFTPGAPGRLVPALNRRRRPDTGFIPDPLPRAWDAPPQTRQLLAQAQAALEKLRLAGAQASSLPLASGFLQLREAICSSVSDRDAQTTEVLLSFAPPAEGAYRDPLKAWRSAYRYRSVLAAGHATLAGARPPALRALLLQIHAGLFEGRPRRSVFPGRLRRGPIQMGDSARYVPPPQEWVVPCLAALERGLAQPSTIDPLLRAFLTHYQIASIHPFADGNGRVSRILLALMLNRAAGMDGGPPLVYLSPYFTRHKGQYTARQYRVNTHGAWQVWLDFCLKALIAEAGDGVRRIAWLGKMRAQQLHRLGALAAGDALYDELLLEPSFSEPRFAALCARLGRDARTELERYSAAGLVRAAGARWPRQRYLPAVVALLARDALPVRRAGAAAPESRTNFDKS